MPIDREDGRHWCNPATEEPGEDGSWTCPGCGTVWWLSDTRLGPVWESQETRDERLAWEAANPAPETSEAVEEVPETDGDA